MLTNIKRITKFIKILTILLVIVAQFAFAGSKMVLVAQEEKPATNAFDTKKSQVQTQIDDISLEINTLVSKQQNLDINNFNLKTQIDEFRSELTDLDKLLIETKIVISQVDKEISSQKDKIDESNKSLQELFLELQNQKNTPFLKTLLSGKNFGEVLGNLHKLDTIEDQILQNKKSLELKKDQLEQTKLQNIQVKQQLEQTRLLIKSKQSSLQTTLSYNEASIDKLIESMKNQKKELDAQLDTLSGDYLAEIANLKTQNTQFISYSSQTNCDFEAKTSLNIPNNFFQKPTEGWVTQVFHCSHDGIDIANSLGTSINSVADGVVVQVGAKMDDCIGFKCNGGFGNYLVIKHTVNSEEVYSLYGHLQYQPTVLVGQNVTKGQIVGQMGCTGYTIPFPCGVHLHFMLISQSVSQYGLGCKFGKNKCYNPQNLISF